MMEVIALIKCINQFLKCPSSISVQHCHPIDQRKDHSLTIWVHPLSSHRYVHSNTWSRSERTPIMSIGSGPYPLSVQFCRRPSSTEIGRVQKRQVNWVHNPVVSHNHSTLVEWTPQVVCLQGLISDSL